MLSRGEIVAATYQIGTEIARTETGIVYEAHDRLLDRLVALKLQWPEVGTPSLILEARRCAAVHDGCSVQVHWMGTHEGRELVVAERVSGKPLADELERAHSPELYLSRFRTLVAAIARAHEAGIGVGDISGATVLVSQAGRLVFGRLSLSQVPAFGRHGQILAPEVVRGEVQASDPAAAQAIDLYGLGCVAIEMARGAPPFADDDRETELRGHASMAPPRIADLRADLPGELSDLVDWLLMKHPAARPRSAHDVLLQVDAMIDRLDPPRRSLRVLFVDDDAARARWLWALARRADAGTIVDTAAEGSEAAQKLAGDRPDVVFIAASLRGEMNALELCMYAHGLESWQRSPGEMYLIGSVGERDLALFNEAHVQAIPDDGNLATAILDRIRAAVAARPRSTRSRSTISG